MDSVWTVWSGLSLTYYILTKAPLFPKRLLVYQPSPAQPSPYHNKYKYRKSPSLRGRGQVFPTFPSQEESKYYNITLLLLLLEKRKVCFSNNIYTFWGRNFQQLMLSSLYSITILYFTEVIDHLVLLYHSSHGPDGGEFTRYNSSPLGRNLEIISVSVK